MKPSASSIFSRAVRSRIIRKLPDGQISMESPKQVASLSRSSKLCELHRKVDSQRSTALSKLRSGSFSHSSSSLEEKRKQIASYAEGAYASIAKAMLFRLTVNLQPKKQCENKISNRDILLSTPVTPSPIPNHNSTIQTSVLDHLWHTSAKIPQNSNQSTMIQTQVQVETPVAAKEISWTSKDARDVPKFLYEMDQDVKPWDLSKLMQDAATVPFLNIPTDIDFNDRICYSPADLFKLQPGPKIGSSISRLSAESSNLDCELSFDVSPKDLDAFKWQPRSPDECWQPSVLL